MKRAWHPALFLALLAATSGSAHADPFCETLEGIAQKPTAEAVQMTLPVDAAPDATCGRSLSLSGTRSFHCNWAFAYRSDAAAQALEKLLDALATCFGPEVQSGDATVVNHPDSYDLHLFRMGQGVAYASLKDKGALQATLVFLRIEAAPAP